MKLLRVGELGKELPAVMDADGALRNLSGAVSDIAGAALLPASLEKLSKINLKDLPLIAGTPRIGACVGGVGKFICIGLNYSDHAAESGMAVPAEPVVFMKATSSICDPQLADYGALLCTDSGLPGPDFYARFKRVHAQRY